MATVQDITTALKPESDLDAALLACYELQGFIQLAAKALETDSRRFAGKHEAQKVFQADISLDAALGKAEAMVKLLDGLSTEATQKAAAARTATNSEPGTVCASRVETALGEIDDARRLLSVRESALMELSCENSHDIARTLGNELFEALDNARKALKGETGDET